MTVSPSLVLAARRLIGIVAIALSACGVINDGSIAAKVQPLLQQSLDENRLFKHDHATVESVTAVHDSGTHYKAIATIMIEGHRHELPLLVTYDNNNLMYEVPPEAIAALAMTTVGQ